MTTGNDSYDWFDALERFDIIFEDAVDYQTLYDRLSEVLGERRAGEQLTRILPTQRQIDTALFHFGQQRQQAVILGYTADRFIRAGRQVTQLRDARGRFVAQGAAEITQRLARGAG